MRHVELLGLPGAGKSTLTRAIARKLAEHGAGIDLDRAVHASIRQRGDDPVARLVATVVGPSGKLWKAAYGRSADRVAALSRFLADHPETLEAVLRAQRLRRQRDRHQEVVLGWILNLAARFQLASEVVDGYLLIDEGFCQRAVALFAFGFSDEDRQLLESYIDSIPLPHLVVSVQVDSETARQRLNRRGWSERLAGADSSMRDRFIADAGIVVGLVEEALQDRTEVLAVDGTEPADEVAEHAVQHLLAAN